MGGPEALRTAHRIGLENNNPNPNKTNNEPQL